MFRGSTYSIETEKDMINNSEFVEEEEVTIALLGRCDVGKSSMLACIENQPFREDIPCTKFLQPRLKKLRFNKDFIINLFTWDGPGDQMVNYIYDGTLDSIDGFLEIFDLTDPSSLQTLESFHSDLKKIRKKNNQTLISVIVGNKSDLYEQLKHTPIQYERAKQIDNGAKKIAKSENILYLKTSAKKNSFVKDCFVELIKQILEKRNSSKKIIAKNEKRYRQYSEQFTDEDTTIKCNFCERCRLF